MISRSLARFDIEDKAQAMIQDMKDRIADIQEKVSTIPESERVQVVTVQYVYENEFLGRGVRTSIPI